MPLEHCHSQHASTLLYAGARPREKGPSRQTHPRRAGSSPILTTQTPARHRLRLPAGTTTASARAAPQQPGASMRQRGCSLRETEPRARRRSAPNASSSAPTPRLSARVKATRRRPSCRRRASTPRRLRRAAPTIANAVAAAELAALRVQCRSSQPIPSAPATRRRASMARRALARSSSPCGHPPLEKPARLLRAALWAQEERPCRLAAEERLWRCARSVADFTALDHSELHR